ncbi:hypothetical protein N0V90_011694 [Kalmusia sp. IMI 367209]|nr:hypothetical protein N0V90_011694 [Kalmusia sp. IMI 367209]
MANDDMKLFVRILHNVSPDGTPRTALLAQEIEALPSYLRSSGSHKPPSTWTGQVHPGHLCNLHKGLKKALCYEIWGLVKHEIESIREFVYPVLASGELREWEKLKARQLEPVPQMYDPNFDMYAYTPDNHAPINPGILNETGEFVARYGYDATHCPACMLSRIGSDADVLFALLAGTVARVSPRHIGTKENLTSRRVRFLKYWLEACEGGKKPVDDAWTLAAKMRDIRRVQRAIRGRKVTEQLQKANIAFAAGETTAFCCDNDVVVDLSDAFAPAHFQAGTHTNRTYPDLVLDTDCDQDSFVGVDLSEPFIPYMDHGSCSQENPLPRSGLRGSTENSVVAVDISDPLVPAPLQATRYEPTPCMQDAIRSSIVPLDISEPYDPAPTQTLHPQASTLPGMATAVPGRLSDTYASIQRCPSIASSFATEWSWNNSSSLSQYRRHPDPYAQYLRIPCQPRRSSDAR